MLVGLDGGGVRSASSNAATGSAIDWSSWATQSFKGRPKPILSQGVLDKRPAPVEQHSIEWSVQVRIHHRSVGPADAEPGLHVSLTHQQMRPARNAIEDRQ
jgi:hypothetical protein